MKVSVPSTHHHCIKTSCEQNQNENQFLDKLKRCFACIFPFSNPNHRQEYDRQNMNSLIATEANSRHASVATSATGGTIMTMEISEGSQPHSISRSREDVGYLLQQQPTQHQHQQQRRRQLENQIHISSSRQNSRAMVSSNEEKEILKGKEYAAIMDPEEALNQERVSTATDKAKAAVFICKRINILLSHICMNATAKNVKEIIRVIMPFVQGALEYS